MQIERGALYPLGATPLDDGVNFALVSEHASRVELCLYDYEGKTEVARLDLPGRDGDLWHGFVPGLDKRLTYGYRVYGPYEPELGHRFNPNKLLLDPYAKGLAGQFKWTQKHFGYDSNSPLKDLSFSNRDNANQMVKARIIDPPMQRLSEQRDRRFFTHNRIVYELHVKGFTQKLELKNDTARGTLAALAEPETLSYLRSLGVTSLELLPVHGFINDYFLHQRRLTNYWGYNSLAFFAPHQAYLPGSDPLVFRAIIDRIHDAGLEVILDVVYNHTAESDQLGPTLSMRGIDNNLYYRLAADKRHYVNDTGCGNTLNVDHPRVVQLIMDSLRYWVSVQGVDGFRFDLASILGRRQYGFDPHHPLLQAIAQDPLLNQVLMIAEPWDIGPGGYQLGAFPQGWLEWNDRYRDCVRRFWRGDAGVIPEFARRLHGSADIFEGRRRRPAESLNFITSHDGFTLRDLVSYQHRHNRANGEHNRDGHHENFSSNSGHEGETNKIEVLQRRDALQRALLMTLMLSQGTPMVLAGDERGRTQRGNNNAYSQDNELNWLDWDLDPQQHSLLGFVRDLIAIRADQPLLGCPDYIHAAASHEERATLWFTPDGQLMSDSDWHQPDLAQLGYLLRGKPGEPSLYILFNRAEQEHVFRLPALDYAPHWRLAICSAPTAELQSDYAAGTDLSLPAHSAILLSADR
ncbi:MAG TPA: glycogen debranching protein GlgX [Marinobacterium sp.]|nr:glycogen debranching protein GlgX [Marinobacterium sp.]